MKDDLISRRAAIDVIYEMHVGGKEAVEKALPNTYGEDLREIAEQISTLPTVQPERKYTDMELEEFRHGVSLSLLDKRSGQHWCYDDETAKKIEFLERLYEKICADMRGDKDER